MPASEETLVDLIYDAVVSPSLWVDVAADVISFLGGEDGSITRLDIEKGTGSILAISDDDSVLERYAAHFYKINPLQLVGDPSTYLDGWTPKVLIDEDLMPRAQFERTEYYNDFLRPISAERSMMVRLGLRGSEVAALNVARPFRRGRFDPSEIATAARLQSHLVRANALGENFKGLEALNIGLGSALDQTPAASFLIDDEARITYANTAGDLHLKRAEIVCGRNGRLAARNAASEADLGRAVAGATARQPAERHAGSFIVWPPGRELAATVTVTPLRSEQARAAARGAAAIVSISDRRAASTPMKDRLGAVFGLTPAEARLGAALCEGMSLQEASMRYKISVNTARVQLATIFSKTGVHRQIDFVRLAADCEGPRSQA